MYFSSPVPVALGDTLVFVPQGGLDGDATASGTPHLAAGRGHACRAPYRAALADLAQAWWADHLFTGFLPTILTPVHPLNPLPLDLPDGYVGLTGQDGLDSALPDYTGAAVAGRRCGAAYYAREMALRRAPPSDGTIRRMARGSTTSLDSLQNKNLTYAAIGRAARRWSATH